MLALQRYVAVIEWRLCVLNVCSTPSPPIASIAVYDKSTNVLWSLWSHLYIAYDAGVSAQTGQTPNQPACCSPTKRGLIKGVLSKEEFLSYGWQQRRALPPRGLWPGGGGLTSFHFNHGSTTDEANRYTPGLVLQRSCPHDFTLTVLIPYA